MTRLHLRRAPGTRSMLTVFLALGSLLVTAPSADAQATPGSTPISVDPNVRTGQLENGFRYVIRENDEPEQRAEFRLIVNVGSVFEDEDQLGLAHFAEHMAFNGTENFAKDELVDYLEGVGMRLGPDLNAFTSFDETVYILPVPTDDPTIVETAIQILEEWAHRVTFELEEIEKERGVIIEEWRLGRGAAARMADVQIPAIFAGSKYTERLPIGDIDLIRTFERDVLVRFYEEWYRPELMSVVAVGDFDGAEIERMIVERFAPLENPPTARERVQVQVPGHQETIFAIATDPEATGSSVGVAYKQPVRAQNTLEQYRQSLVENLYNTMLNERLFELVQQAEPPFLGAGSSQGMLIRSKELYQLGAAVEDGKIVPGLTALLAEAERVARFGFTEGEVDRATRNLLRGIERAYAERANRSTASYVAEYQRHLLEGEAIPGIERERELFQQLLPTIDVEEVNRLAREWLVDTDRVILVNAPERPDLETPTEADLLSAFDAVESMELTPYEYEESDAPLIESLPPRGSVISEEEVPELGLTVWELSNGARVIAKPTDFKDDEVVMQAYSPGGHSLSSDDAYLSASSAALFVSAGGVGAFSSVELDRKLAGIVAGVSPSIGSLTEGMTGGASPEDIETLFELVHLYFTAPRKDPVIFEALKVQLRSALANRDASPGQAFSDTLTMVLTQHHPRAIPLRVEDVDRLDLDVAFDFYQDRFSDAGDFTFVFVGVLDLDELRDLAERYLATLPATGRVESGADVGIDPPLGIEERTVRRGLEPQSQTQLVFAGEFEFSPHRQETIRLLADVLQTRLRDVLREELGGTYSVSASGNTSREPDQEYSVGVSFGSDPDRADELTAAVFEEIENIRSGSVPLAEQLETAKEARRRTHEVNVRLNTYWAAQLVAYDRYDVDIDRILNQSAMEAVTEADIIEAAQAYLSSDRYVRVTLVPEANVSDVNVSETGGVNRP